MRGLLCFEEPENGIHPGRIGAMVRLLGDIAVDPELPVGEDNPLRQVVVNTHSPKLFAAVPPADLIYFRSTKYGDGGAVLTRPAAPAGTWRTRVGADGNPVTPPLAPGAIRPYYGEEEYRRLRRGEHVLEGDAA